MEKYRGLNIYKDKKSVLVEGIKDFDPVHTFECGQCFRWIRQEDGSFVGVSGGRVVRVNFVEGILRIDNSCAEDFKEYWFNYFDFGTDYGAIKDILSKDEIMKTAIEFGGGIRILRQEFYETLVSFIISANNGISRIMQIVDVIAKEYGELIKMDGKDYFSFPAVNKLSSSSVEALNVCRGGYRCEYIVKTAAMIVNEEVSFSDIGNMTTEKAQEQLKKFPGIGPKVADCILLYSGTKQDVFPTDVWVKRVMEELYFKSEASFSEIQQLAKDKFGVHTGIAQQYLFYYARQNKIGTKK